jgi:hypothetical protein
MDLWAIVAGALSGVLSGALIAGAGYFKTITDKGLEKFDALKFFTTVAIGAAAGGWASWSGTGYDVAMTVIVAGGYTVLIENWAKAIWRWFKVVTPEAK